MGGTLQPVQYEFNDQSNTALVTFHGYLDIDPHQYNGGYKFSSITLSGNITAARHNKRDFMVTIYLLLSSQRLMSLVA